MKGWGAIRVRGEGKGGHRFKKNFSHQERPSINPTEQLVPKHSFSYPKQNCVERFSEAKTQIFHEILFFILLPISSQWAKFDHKGQVVVRTLDEEEEEGRKREMGGRRLQ